MLRNVSWTNCGVLCTRKKRTCHVPNLYCETYGDAWVWLAFAPVWRVVLAFVVGKRTQENADLLFDRVKDVTDGDIPFFTRDQLPEYDDALLHTYGVWVQPERKGDRGRYPQPRFFVPTRPICCTLKLSKCESMAG